MNLPKPEIGEDDAIELWNKERSEYSKEQLVLNTQWLIRLTLTKLNLDAFDEDLYSVGMIGLIKAVNKFDSEKGVKFATFAAKVIMNEIITILRKKRINVSISLDDVMCYENGVTISKVDTFSSNAWFEDELIMRMQVNFVLSELSEREYQVVRMYSEGNTQKQISEVVGVSQSYVSRILKSACKKFRCEFE